MILFFFYLSLPLFFSDEGSSYVHWEMKRWMERENGCHSSTLHSFKFPSETEAFEVKAMQDCFPTVLGCIWLKHSKFCWLWPNLIKRNHFLSMIKRFRVSLPIFSKISALTDESAVVRDPLSCKKAMLRNEKSEVEQWLFLSVSLCLQTRWVLALVPCIECYLDICK